MLFSLFSLMNNFESLVQLVKEAGKKTLEYYGKSHHSEIKTDGSLLTEADVEANKILVNGLKDLFPNDGRLSEESEDSLERLTKERVWIIDPIDGTADFHLGEEGKGDFAVIVGLSVNGKAEFGVLYAPVHNTLFIGQRGQGSYIITPQGKRRLLVSDRSRVQDMTLIVNSRLSNKDIDKITKYVPVKNLSRGGSAGLRVCRMANQEADIHISFTGKDWDYCASDIILSEAGGVMTDLENNPCMWNNKEPEKKTMRVSTNGKAHEEILNYVRAYVAAERSK